MPATCSPSRPPGEGALRRRGAGSRRRRRAHRRRGPRRRDARLQRPQPRSAGARLTAPAGTLDGPCNWRRYLPCFAMNPRSTRALGEPDARLAIGEVARPIALAALAGLSHRSPLVVACPTGTMAGQLADDLAQFLAARSGGGPAGMGDAAVRAGEPVGRDDGPAPRVALAAARARALPGGHRRRCASAAPAPRSRRGRRRARHRAPGRGDRPRRPRQAPRELRLPPRGAGRAPWRVRPAWRDHRRVPVHRRRTRAHRPVGRRGRPPHDVRRERPTLDGRCRRGDRLPGSRADPDRRRSRARASASSPPSRGAASTGNASAEGALFDGMESWLPWLCGDGLATTSRCSPTCCPSRPRSCWSNRGAAATGRSTCSPRRTTSRGPWRPRGSASAELAFPRLHAEPDRLLAGVRRVLVDRRGARVAGDTDRRGVGLGPGRGRRRRGSSHRLNQLLARRLPGRGRRRRRRLGSPASRACSSTTGLDLPVVDPSATDITRPGGRIVVAPLHHGVTIPNGLGRRDRRERPHRTTARPPPSPTPPPRRRRGLRGPQAGDVRRALPARRRPVRGDGQALDRRRRARLPAPCLQGQRQALRPVGPDRHAAPVRRRRGARRCTASAGPTSPRPRAGCARRCARSPRSSSCSTRSG